MHLGLSPGGEGADDPAPQAEVRRRRRGDHAALQDDGLLLEGGALLRREGALTRWKCRIILITIFDQSVSLIGTER